MSFARQPNIDLCVAQNAPINDFLSPLPLPLSLPLILSHPLHYHKEEVHERYRCVALVELPDKPAYSIETGV
jgi:hypothetical protein